MAASIGAVTLGSAARVLPVQRSQPVRAMLHAPQTHISQPAPARLAGVSAQRQSKLRQKVVAQASEAEKDFDGILSDIADKFEKSDKKGAIIGYTAAAAIAIFFSEWLIHLPLLNVLLGFPIQLVGLLSLPYVVVKYAVDGDDYVTDLKSATDRVVKELPGLGK